MTEFFTKISEEFTFKNDSSADVFTKWLSDRIIEVASFHGIHPHDVKFHISQLENELDFVLVRLYTE